MAGMEEKNLSNGYSHVCASRANSNSQCLIMKQESNGFAANAGSRDSSNGQDLALKTSSAIENSDGPEQLEDAQVSSPEENGCAHRLNCCAFGSCGIRLCCCERRVTAQPLLARSGNGHEAIACAADMSYIIRKTSSLHPPSIKDGSFEKEADVATNWNNYSASSCNDRYYSARRPCRPTFIFDPAGSFCYRWSMVVSAVFLYNIWVMIYRFSFDEITNDSVTFWFVLDYGADLVYVLDILMHMRTAYLEEGVLQTDSKKMRLHYMNTTRFYLDCLCLLPLDFLYLSIGFHSIVRCFRLVKVYRFWSFIDKTERHTNYPNFFRAAILMHYILLLCHWNACLIFALRGHLNFGEEKGQSQKFQPTTALVNDATASWSSNTSDQFYNYLIAYYLSSRALTLISTLPPPREHDKVGYAFVIVEVVMGLLLFATVLGHIANIVSNVSSARKEFQAHLDRVKTYMSLRRVPDHLQMKVIRWFDYLWSSKRSSSETQVLDGLPDKLKAEVAIHVHLDTLKRVEIFQNTEPGFLCELVLLLKPLLFSPGDYICRRGTIFPMRYPENGEVGKEMYIVNRGKLHVLADNNTTILATLKAGSYFGEISILNMGSVGNRRTASVVSVGYSDLFCLSKRDIWEVLRDYPAARMRLESIAAKRLFLKRQEEIERKAREEAEALTIISENQSTAVGVIRPDSAPGFMELSTRSQRGSFLFSPLKQQSVKSQRCHSLRSRPTAEVSGR